MESVIPTPKKVKVLNPGDEIQGEVRRLAQEIRRDYQGKNPLLIGILKGSFVFLADHIRLLEIPAEVDFARLSSYGAAQTSSGTVRMGHSVQATLAGRDVLIIDDIADTGLSIDYMVNYIKKRKPASVRTTIPC